MCSIYSLVSFLPSPHSFALIFPHTCSCLQLIPTIACKMSARRLNQVSGDLDEDASVAWFKARFAARAPAPAHQASTATQLPISGQSSSARSTAPSAPFAPAPRSMLDTESHHSSPANPQIHQPNNHQSNSKSFIVNDEGC